MFHPIFKPAAPATRQYECRLYSSGYVRTCPGFCSAENFASGRAVNTPAHLILGAAVFARPHAASVTAGALAGSLLPDISLYAMASFALFVQKIPPSVVFGDLYFSQEWQNVFAVDNSVFVWLCVAALGYWLRRGWLAVLGAAAILHLAADFPLHHDDGRPHFWPFSDWIFSSPVSYWDPAHYGQIAGALEAALCLVLCIALFRRFRGLPARALICLAALVESVPAFATLLSVYGA